MRAKRSPRSGFAPGTPWRLTRDGEFDMIYPTIRTLQAVADFSSAAEVLAFAP